MFRAYLRFVLTLCMTAWAAVHAATPSFRLPTEVAPLAYHADLSLDPAKTRFSGVMVIDVQIKQATNEVWLNGSGLTIEHAELRAQGRTYVARAAPEHNAFIGLHFAQPVPPGMAQVSLRYSGKIFQGATAGIFLATDAGNRYLLTQFESTDARWAFPCFDEPGYKTPWQLTLRVPKGQVAVSNTPIDQESDQGASHVVKFRSTRPLPSYLIAFGVGPFEFVDAGRTETSRAPIRIVVPKGKTEEARYAAQVTAPILSRLEAYFGIPYPYAKSDQLAIPISFGFGAMENAGLVTYQQTLLLSSAENDSIARQRSYARTAAHELAHQWFGDYVTPKWWDDTWLNEAFATWMATKIVSEWQPQWGDQLDETDAKARVEAEDSLISARKIHQEVQNDSDIANAFDGITYEKGAAVIAMFEHSMGAEKFRQAVQQYMKDHAYGNADAGEFLAALDAVQPVSSGFRSFIDQPGVPLVSVQLSCNPGSAALHVSQQRLLPLGSAGTQGALWSLPLCLGYDDHGQSKSVCMPFDQPSLDVPLVTETGSCPAYLDANAGAFGYYLPLYSPELLSRLTAPKALAELSVGERLDLLDDVGLLSAAGQMPAIAGYQMVQVFHDDGERHVVASALAVALQNRSHRVSTALEPHFQRFIEANFGDRARQLGWTPSPGEAEDVSVLRRALVAPVAMYGGDTVLATAARNMTEAWLSGAGSLDPGMMEPILEVAAYHGDEALVRRLLDKLQTTQDRQVRSKLLRGLQYTRDPAAIGLLYDTVLAGKIPFIEGSALLFIGQGQESTRSLSFDFVRAHYDQIIERRPQGADFDFAALLPRSATSFCTPEQRDAVKTFFDGRTTRFQGGERDLAQVLEGIDLCIARQKAQQAQVAAFLEAQ